MLSRSIHTVGGSDAAVAHMAFVASFGKPECSKTDQRRLGGLKNMDVIWVHINGEN